MDASDSDSFELHRPHLMSVAYRMLGSVSDAEDILQEAFLRWRAAEGEIRSPKAFLTTIVTRLCLDNLKSASVRRTSYIGSWLPEPTTSEWESDSRARDSMSFAFMVMLEALSPLERAVFLLRDAFDYDYAEISGVVEKSEENCRQIFHRARQSLETRRRRFDATPAQRDKLLRHFLFACVTGDLRGLEAALREDAILVADGGGKVPSAIHPIVGRTNVARFFLGVRDKQPRGAEQLLVRVNGEETLVTYDHGRPVAILSVAADGERIGALYNVRNPDKLKSIAAPTSRARTRTALQYLRMLIQVPLERIFARIG